MQDESQNTPADAAAPQPTKTIPPEVSGLQTIAEDIPIDHIGTAVYVKGHIHPDSKKHAIVFVHDIGENIGLYRDATKEFVERGYNVYNFDLRGHGKSGGLLGHTDSFSDYANDLLQVAAWVRFKSNGKPPIIVGHGIGAIITIYFQIKYPRLCHAAVLSAPALRLKRDIPRWRRFIVRRLADITPRLKLPRSILPKFTTTPQVGGEGSLIHSLKPTMQNLTAKAASELIRGIEWSPGRFLKFSANALVLCPDNDPIFTYDFINELLSRHKNREKITVHKLVSGHNTLIENADVVKNEVDLICKWLESLEATAPKSAETPPI